MKAKSNKTKKRGLALIVVLIIIMAITVLSMGFLSRSDVELACGENMILRTQMDYLAESALEHAKGLILNPQDVTSEYWLGAQDQQLVAGSDNYYDVNVVKLGELNYQITSTAYREKGGEQVGSSSLRTELRIDPYIAYWQSGNQSISSQVTITGDVYCDSSVQILGVVYGDVFAAGTITGGAQVSGQKYGDVTTAPVSSPNLAPSDFSSQYYYDGSGPYTSQQLSAEYDEDFPGPGMDNPASVYYCDGSLGLNANIVINGTLVVKDDLTFDGNEGSIVAITPLKNMPALIVGNDLQMKRDNLHLTVNGLAQVGHYIDMGNKTDSCITVHGALCVLDKGIMNTTGCTVEITAAPDKAAIEIWPGPGTAQRWSPAAGAFFKGIRRQ
jgi:Tfp pilus assembly protein PilX